MLGPSLHPLRAVGWSERVAALFAPLLDRAPADPALRPARVLGVARASCELATPDGLRHLPLFGIAVGDWVALHGDDLYEVVPRWSALERLDPHRGYQVLAANVDVVLVAAPGDRLSPARVERELAIAWDSGARPVVVLTKVDLAPPAVVADLVSRLGTVEVIPCSAVEGRGFDALRALLVHPVTAVLLGPSGAGKSTLINALIGQDRLAVGAVREGDGRGRHTTTSRQLVPVPSGGSLIDMPGLRSLGTDASVRALAATFADIDQLAQHCRFGDCSHEVEPGCAVTAAVGNGALEGGRLVSYRKLGTEGALEQRRTDPVARSNAAMAWKTRSKQQRHTARGRDDRP